MISKTQKDDFLNLDVEQFKKNPMYKVFKIIHRCLYLHVILQDEWMDVFIYIYWYSHIDYLILCDYIYIHIQMSHIYPFLASRCCKTRRAITSRNGTGNFLPWRTHRVRAKSPQRLRRWPKKCFLQQQCCRGCGNNINHNHNLTTTTTHHGWILICLIVCLFWYPISC